MSVSGFSLFPVHQALPLCRKEILLIFQSCLQSFLLSSYLFSFAPRHAVYQHFISGYSFVLHLQYSMLFVTGLSHYYCDISGEGL